MDKWTTIIFDQKNPQKNKKNERKKVNKKIDNDQTKVLIISF